MLNSSNTENLRGLGECNRADHRIKRESADVFIHGALNSLTTSAIDGFVKSCQSDY